MALLAILLSLPSIGYAEERNLTDGAVEHAKQRIAEAVISLTGIADPRITKSLSVRDAKLARYGFDLIRESSSGTLVRLRSGISGFSTKAAAGVQLVVNW